MKLRNKKTGEVVEVESCNSATGTIGLFFAEGRECDRAYNSLAEFNEEWEDCEEPKEYYALDLQGDIIRWARHSWDEKTTNKIKEIGNYFETEEEAEQAVEKLKAWKRLKDKGFRFGGYTDDSADLFSCQVIRCSFNDFGEESRKDLDLLFGGKK